MGVTISYRGTLKDLDRVEDFENRSSGTRFRSLTSSPSGVRQSQAIPVPGRAAQRYN
jgi:hypothetical protein